MRLRASRIDTRETHLHFAPMKSNEGNWRELTSTNDSRDGRNALSRVVEKAKS